MAINLKQLYNIFKNNFDNFSGFEKIKLKKIKVENALEQLKRTKQIYKSQKTEFERISEERKTLQQDLDALRDRPHLSPLDITRLTTLYHKTHALTTHESESRQSYKLASEDYERAQEEYLGEMRERYIEEQVYSDRVKMVFTLGRASDLPKMWIEPRKKRELRESLKEIVDSQAVINQELVKSIVDQQNFKAFPDTSVPRTEKDTINTIQEENFVIMDDELLELQNTLKSSSFLAGMTTGTLLTIFLSFITSK